MSTNLYLDIHVLQNVPPSNINRDDTGSPKQARYGGVNRARVSSQSWKRATRKHFAEATGNVNGSTRTKRVHALLTERIASRLALESELASKIATQTLAELGIKPDKKKKATETDSPETGYLLFFGIQQIEAVVDDIAAIDADWEQLGDADLAHTLSSISVKDRLSTAHPVDVALFGRMVADLTSLNVDAAVQVAHAISTHEVFSEFDYFTAVDDEKASNIDEDAGAAMIGTVEFNSSTLYRYAGVGIRQLLENLDDDVNATAAAVVGFVDGFVRSMPTGKLNTFANRTLPSVVITVLRDDQSVNLVGAFEQPVATGAGLMAKSAERLASHLIETQNQWATTPMAMYANYAESLSEQLRGTLGNSVVFPELLDNIRGLIGESLVKEPA